MTAGMLALGAQPRILFLCADAQAMRAQLSGVRLAMPQASALRDDVSTDESRRQPSCRATLQPSCGACASCGPGSSTNASQVTVGAINRNFPGRSGPGQVWLASPPTVMASALAGELISLAALQRRHG